MLPVHTFQQYRAFTLRQETGIHRLMHNLAVGIDVGCEGRVAKSERHHSDLGEMYRHAVGPMPDLPFKGYGMLSAGQYEFLPCFLHVLEHAQIGLQIISGRGLDVGMSELSCDHADVGSGLDCQRAERVTQIAWRDRG